MNKSNKSALLIIIVAALGYFVDIYDLILFSIIRKKSLMSIGIPESACLENGEHLISMQMYGMLLGGILWGILGDKKGRLSVLFGSIVMYSIANIANGFIQTVEEYAIWRFIAGVGLAGELGAGITLVSESMSKEKRGYGTMAIVSFGVLGGVMAAMVGSSVDWRMAYYIGGGMGLVLLLLRVGVFESGMYKSVRTKDVSRGNFFMLFNNKKRFYKYLQCITIGLPIWFLIGILVTFSPEFAKAIGVQGIESPMAVGIFYASTSLGDFLSGFFSQIFKSRKKIVYAFLGMTAVGIPLYLFNQSDSPWVFYAICGFLGLAGGYWAIFVTIASEQFGTNLRATVTTTVPNFVRGFLPFLLIGFKFLRTEFSSSSTPFFASTGDTPNPNVILYSALIIGCATLLIAIYAVGHMDETYAKDLDYTE